MEDDGMRPVWVAVLMASAAAANAADISSVSAIERVTVYPDGASVVRTIEVDVPAGDNVVVAPDFPLALDPSSLRVEGEAPVQLAVGAVEAKPPRPEEPPKLDNARIEQLQDEIGHQDDIIEKVKVERITVRKNATTPSGVAGYLAKSKTEEREYKFTVHNGHDVAVAVRIEDRLPVSENDEVKVEVLPGSSPPAEQDVRDRRGIQAWTLGMKPNSDQSLAFGWRVSWPKEKDLVMD
jgi:hypothetical protein